MSANLKGDPTVEEPGPKKRTEQKATATEKRTFPVVLKNPSASIVAFDVAIFSVDDNEQVPTARRSLLVRTKDTDCPDRLGEMSSFIAYFWPP